MKTLLSGLVLLLATSLLQAQNTDSLRLNQIQIIGSHNSYKKLPDPRVMKFLLKQSKHLGKELDPRGIDYGHLPFDSQFTAYNMRGLEIDVYNDPQGGVFYKRRINAFVRGMHQRSKVEALRKPGFKVLHIKDVDYQTNYYTFKDALTALKTWSDAHPNHLPIFINLETKDAGPANRSKLLRMLGFKRTVPYTTASCDSLDAEVKAVFGDSLNSILTPDKLKGSYASLGDMVKHNGWPLLNECRGKIIFILFGEAQSLYIDKHPGLSGRAMCIYGHKGSDDCVFLMRDEAVRDSALITDLVKQGYIVRTRSDIETVEARNNDSSRKWAAFNCGAQITSTDYYKPDLRLSNFTVQWDGLHAGRVNKVLCPQKNGEWLKE